MNKIKHTKQKKLFLSEIKNKVKNFNKIKFRNFFTKNLIVDKILFNDVDKILSTSKLKYYSIDIESVTNIQYMEKMINEYDILVINNLDTLHKNALKYKLFCQLLVYKILNGKKVDTMFIVFLDKPLEQLLINNIVYFPSKNKVGEDDEDE